MKKSRFSKHQIIKVLKLDRTAAWRGYPAKLRMDNGPDLFPCNFMFFRRRYSLLALIMSCT